MAGLNEIIALCKSGRVLDAYNQAKVDLEQENLGRSLQLARLCIIVLGKKQKKAVTSN